MNSVVRTSTKAPSVRAAKPRAAAAKLAKRDGVYHHGDLALSTQAIAWQLLRENGTNDLSLREVARRAGVSHRAVYRHFPDKRALLAALAGDGYRALAVALEAGCVRDQDVPAQLGALAATFLRFARDEPARYQLMFGPRLNEDARFPELEQAIDEAVAVLRSVLRAVAPNAQSQAIRDAGIAVFAAIHGLSSLVLAHRVPLKDSKTESYIAATLGPMFEGVVKGLVLDTTI